MRLISTLFDYFGLLVGFLTNICDHLCYFTFDTG